MTREESIKLLKNIVEEYKEEKEFVGKDLIEAIEYILKENEENELDFTTVFLNGIYEERGRIRQMINQRIHKLEEKQKEELKGTKGQDRYAIKQEYMFKINTLINLLEDLK